MTHREYPEAEPAPTAELDQPELPFETEAASTEEREGDGEAVHQAPQGTTA